MSQPIPVSLSTDDFDLVEPESCHVSPFVDPFRLTAAALFASATGPAPPQRDDATARRRAPDWPTTLQHCRLVENHGAYTVNTYIHWASRAEARPEPLPFGYGQVFLAGPKRHPYDLRTVCALNGRRTSDVIVRCTSSGVSRISARARRRLSPHPGPAGSVLRPSSWNPLATLDSTETSTSPGLSGCHYGRRLAMSIASLDDGAAPAAGPHHPQGPHGMPLGSDVGLRSAPWSCSGSRTSSSLPALPLALRTACAPGSTWRWGRGGGVLLDGPGRHQQRRSLSYRRHGHGPGGSPGGDPPSLDPRRLDSDGAAGGPPSPSIPGARVMHRLYVRHPDRVSCDVTATDALASRPLPGGTLAASGTRGRTIDSRPCLTA
jgi:hypothetical protein